MFEYKDYPQVPRHIVESILEKIEKYPLGFSDKINEAVANMYGEPLKIELEGLAKMSMFSDNELTAWVKNNVSENFNAVHVQYFSNGTYFFPHVDLLRTRALNYIIQTADAETVFYSLIDDTEVRPNKMIPYESIKEEMRVLISPLSWHELQVDKIHSVENIHGTRIAITVSFI